jgi:hypothetical protein
MAWPFLLWLQTESEKTGRRSMVAYGRRTSFGDCLLDMAAALWLAAMPPPGLWRLGKARDNCMLVLALGAGLG